MAPILLVHYSRFAFHHSETINDCIISSYIHRVDIKRILGEYLLISSLPGKAFRGLVDIARLAKRFNMLSQSQAW